MEILKEIWGTAKRNKLRTSLTGFAVAWGIFMIIFLLGAGNGMINAQMEQMDRFLATSMEVSRGWTSKPYKGYKKDREIRLNDRDLAITSNEFTNHVVETGAVLSQNGININYNSNYLAQQSLSGVYPNEMRINKKEIVYGRFINEKDLKERRKVLVLREKQAKELVPGGKGIVGKNVTMDGFSFRVIGILKDDQMSLNSDMYTSFTTLKAIYNKGDNVGEILFSIKNLDTKEANDKFEKYYRTRINNNHDAAPDDEKSIWIWNRKSSNLQMETGVSIIRTALWIIGLFTLISGIVGVSNIMLITVKERTHEFGIRKALGARPWHILRMIIIESVIITTVFGYIGMLCGLAANEYMDATAGQMVMDTGMFKMRTFVNPTVDLDVCLQVVFVIVAAGTIAGLVPALRAARIRPIEALRDE